MRHSPEHSLELATSKIGRLMSKSRLKVFHPWKGHPHFPILQATQCVWEDGMVARSLRGSAKDSDAEKFIDCTGRVDHAKEGIQVKRTCWDALSCCQIRL